MTSIQNARHDTMQTQKNDLAHAAPEYDHTAETAQVPWKASQFESGEPKLTHRWCLGPEPKSPMIKPCPRSY